MTYRKVIGILLVFVLVELFLSRLGQEALAQERVTSTPVRVDVPTSLPIIGDPLATSSPTRTPTVPGPALLEAKLDAGEINVRAEPDTESERLGSIRAGDTYTVLGKYYRWYQFQFDLSPSGRAYVFEELVNIIGDANTILDLSQEALPTTDATIVGATQTQEAITQTPGGLLTATAGSRVLAMPEGASSGAINLPSLPGLPENEGEFLDPLTVLPTFTYPADIVAIAPTQSALITPTTSPNRPAISISNGVPPIIPIAILGGLGLLGLAVSSMTRR